MSYRYLFGFTHGPALEPLAQRVTVRCHLRGLDREQTEAYL